MRLDRSDKSLPTPRADVGPSVASERTETALGSGPQASGSVAAAAAVRPLDPPLIYAATASFLVSLILPGTIVLLLLSMHVVQRVSATANLFLLLPLVGGMIATSVACGRLVTRSDVCKTFAIGSGLALIAGVIALSAIGPDTTHADLAWRLALTGVALGVAQRMFGRIQQVCSSSAGVQDANRMMLITQLAGALVGIGLFAASFTHWLAPELPRHVPLLPGESAHQLQLAQAQREATDVVALRARVNLAIDAQLVVMERALHGDQAAAGKIFADVRIPEEMKAPLREGGVRARVHRHLAERASHIEAQLQEGEDGRDELLADPLLPLRLKQQIASIPERAFRDEDSSERVAGLFRDAILAREDDVVAATTERSVQSVRAAAAVHANQLVERIQQGLRMAFAAAIAETFQAAAWIVALATLIVALVPTAPDHGREQENFASPSGRGRAQRG